MIILKSQTFPTAERLSNFVNDNNILQENIVVITYGTPVSVTETYTIFYYADSESKEKPRGFWG